MFFGPAGQLIVVRGGTISISFGSPLNRYAGGAPLDRTATRSPSASLARLIANTWSGPLIAAVMPDGQHANLARWPF